MRPRQWRDNGRMGFGPGRGDRPLREGSGRARRWRYHKRTGSPHPRIRRIYTCPAAPARKLRWARENQIGFGRRTRHNKYSDAAPRKKRSHSRRTAHCPAGRSAASARLRSASVPFPYPPPTRTLTPFFHAMPLLPKRDERRAGKWQVSPHVRHEKGFAYAKTPRLPWDKTRGKNGIRPKAGQFFLTDIY